MANSKKKAVTKPSAKKSAAPAKKTTPAKTPAKPKAAKPVAAKKAAPTVKKPAAKTPTKKPAVAPKPAPKSPKPAAKTASTAKGSRLQLGKASAAKAPAKKPNAKPAPAAPVSEKKAVVVKKPQPGKTVPTSASTRPTAATTAPERTAKTSKSLLRPSNNSGSPAKAVLRTSSGGGSASSVRRTALAAEPLPPGKTLRTPPARPVSFTLDEVRAIAKSNETKSELTTKTSTAKAAKKASSAAAATPAKTLKPAAIIPPAKPSHVNAASLADILGFNPNAKGPEAAGPVPREVALVPEKFKRYYKLLVELREHLTGQIDQHSEDTLKRSSKDDAGDLSSYGQHMADAGTDTFDRDFALSLVSSEQEALSEIEAAIKRITDGSYGVCEVSGQPIAKARLLAVPFTRYSAEAQKEIERNHYRVRTQAGLFGELGGEDGGKIMDADGD